MTASAVAVRPASSPVGRSRRDLSDVADVQVPEYAYGSVDGFPIVRPGLRLQGSYLDTCLDGPAVSSETADFADRLARCDVS